MISEVMRTRAQTTEMELMATRAQRPIFREKGTLSFQMTGMGRSQMTRSSRALHALLSPSNTRMLMQFELLRGSPAQNSSIGTHWKIAPYVGVSIRCMLHTWRKATPYEKRSDSVSGDETHDDVDGNLVGSFRGHAQVEAENADFDDTARDESMNGKSKVVRETVPKRDGD